MFRFSQEQDSSRTSSTKSFISNPSNAFFAQQNQKSTTPLHQSEVFAQKPHKKGINTIFTHSLQSSNVQSQQKIIYINKKPDPVYEQYVKSLEIQIASRERERLELYKNLQDLKRQNGKLIQQLNEEKKKSAGFKIKTQQMEIFLKQNQDKKRIIINEKDQLFNQYHFEIQRRKSIEQNEQKIRFKFEALQLQSSTKGNQNILAINRANEENKKLKQQIQKLNHQLKTLELSNESYKKQLSDFLLQKSKVIDSILIEKQLIENQLQKQQTEHQELKNIYRQKQDELKNLNKNIIDLQQLKESQKSHLSYEMNQIKLESQNLKRNYQIAKENFKRQLQVLVSEGNRIREIIIQLQKDKNIDKSYITELERQTQVLEQQKFLQIRQKLTLSQQFQKQRKSFQQQKNNLTSKIQFFESNLQQKSKQLQQLNKKQIELQSELQLAKYRNSTQKDLLLREINFLKQQISTQSFQFSSQSTKLIQERQKLQRYFNDELSKYKVDANEKLRHQKETLQKQYRQQLQNYQEFHQNDIKIYENKITELKKNMESANQLYALEKQRTLQQTLIQANKKINIQEANSFQRYQELQSQLKKQLTQKNSLLNSLSEEIKYLNQKINNNQSEIFALKSELVTNQQKYQKESTFLKRQFEKEENQLKDEMSLEKKLFQSENQEIKKQAEKKCGHLQQQINQMQFQIGILKQEKDELIAFLHNLEESTSMSNLQLRNHILSLESHKNELQNEIQRLIGKHEAQSKFLINNKTSQIASIQGDYKSQIHFLKHQSDQKLQLLQNQILSYQQKLKQSQKIIEKKNLQYQELEEHFNLAIERNNQQHTKQIQQYDRELQSMTQKLKNTSHQDLLTRKIQTLQEDLTKKETQLKILEENNTLLRKNFINSLTQQQNLREEMKINKSQHSGSKSQSKQKSRKDTSQQLRNKYLVKNGSEQKISNQLKSKDNEMNLSMSCQRSYSNSRLDSKKFQNTRKSYKYVPLLSLRNVEKNESEFEAQKPMNNMQRSAPFVPLDLKRIRQRNQLHCHSHSHSQTQNKTQNFTQEAKSENQNSDQQWTFSLITPNKLVEKSAPVILIEAGQILEKEDQF